MSSHELDIIESNLPKVSGRVVGEDLPIQTIAQNEIDTWKGKTETSSQVYPTLQKYWQPYSWWDGSTQTPWSAVYVSYILRDQGFDGSPAHVEYVKNVVNGSSWGWKAYSIPKNQGKIQLNVGDVLVKKRSGSNTSSHGDIVYRIDNGQALLTGGNVSNTAKIVGSINLDAKGFPVGAINDYKVILKKNAKLSPLLLIPILLAIGAIAYGVTRK